MKNKLFAFTKNNRVKSYFRTLMILSLVLLFCQFKNESKNSTSLPDSKFNGVQIGTITFSFRGINGVDETIKACVDAGVSSIELMGDGIEEYLGAPKNPVPRGPMGPPPSAQPGAGGAMPPMGPPPQQKLTPEQQVAVDKYKAELKEWRKTEGTIDKYEKLRKKFNDAGISIHIYKWVAGESDEELDYSFKIAKALGAMGISTELSENACKTYGSIAEKNGMVAIFHNHMQYAQPGFDVDKLLAYSPANRLNFDAGHYFGSTGLNPCDFIKKYHDRIASVHLKDKTGPDNATQKNANQVWGQGETPLNELLKLIQKEKWPIYCDIELEYTVAPWSNAVKEVNTCVKFCRQILL
jgi:sugar phosphate isomerase/epimerase